MSSAKFLVAHQDQTIVGLLQAELREKDHFVRFVRTGQDVIDQTLNWQPDALILGLKLQGMSGLDAARALRSMRVLRVPILFLVNNADEAALVTKAELTLVESTLGTLDLFKLRAQIDRLLAAPPAEASATTAAPTATGVKDGFRDPLTGLYDSQFLLDRLEYEAARAARYRTRIALILFGLDDYDRLVDRVGQTSTDQVVVGVANVLRGAVRNVDLIGRFASDKFLMIAPQTDEWGARRFVERILQRVRQFKFDLPSHALPVRLSVGIATAPGNSPEETLGLLKRAEVALAKAHTESHNRISVA